MILPPDGTKRTYGDEEVGPDFNNPGPVADIGATENADESAFLHHGIRQSRKMVEQDHTGGGPDLSQTDRAEPAPRKTLDH